MSPSEINQSPWDTSVFGVHAFELTSPVEEALHYASQNSGHYTVRVDPLQSKKLLYDYGFYYCDTLIEPFCALPMFKSHQDSRMTISKKVSIEDLLHICNGAFSHGRFHRDFEISNQRADERYNRWLEKMHAESSVFGLFFNEKLVGFVAIQDNSLVLHAIDPQYRGQGLAKFLWTPICQMLFDRGAVEIVSSISAANLAVLNLYSSLGFRFRNAVDIYHRLTP
jgi:ribosomal protein S18 acetylase RimI-like enzyme